LGNKIKHLELIQGVINRLSTNSFLLKGWTVVVATTLFAFASGDGDSVLPYLVYLPILVFWGLDGFFLWQERLYRDLYDHVRGQEDEKVNFSMDTSSFKGVKGRSWLCAMMSLTLLIFHGVLLALAIVMMLVNTK